MVYSNINGATGKATSQVTVAQTCNRHIITWQPSKRYIDQQEKSVFKYALWLDEINKHIRGSDLGSKIPNNGTYIPCMRWMDYILLETRPWASIHYAVRRLTARSREVLQVPRQRCCRGACQISERYDHCNIQSRGFETSRDLAVRRLTA